VSIQFSEIHNLVRTYQHVLKLDSKHPPATDGSETPQEDRVTLSQQARALQSAQPPAPVKKPGPDML
jgi:hypothetical protein